MNDKEKYMSILHELEGATDKVAELAHELLQLECTFVHLQEEIYHLFQEDRK